MLRAVIVDPRTEPIPDGWSAFVRAEALPGSWAAAPVAALAWCAPAPTVLAAVVDGAGAPAALFHARHLGLPADPRRFAGATGARGVVAGIVEVRLPPTFALRGYAFAQTTDQRTRAEALAVFERGLRAALGPGLAGIVYRNVPPDDLDAFRAGRWVRPARPEPVILNRWASIDEYLAGLPAKRRAGLTRMERSLAAWGIRADELDAVEPDAAGRLASRVASTHRQWRRGIWPIQPPVPGTYFEALAGQPGVRFLRYQTTSGRLLAFATWLDTGPVLIDSVWGSLDPRDGSRRDLYQHHFLRTVARMVDRGLSQAALGKGVAAMKQEFGAELQPRYLVAARP